MAKYKVVTSDGRIVFSDCAFDEAKHFAASLPKHTQPQIRLQGVPECSRCLGTGYVRARQPGNAAFGMYQCPKCNGDICQKCDGEGWLWWYELDDYEGPAKETGQDDTRYPCDACTKH